MKSSKGFTISELVFVFLIIFVLVLLMMPLMQINREKRDNNICINNLQKIGLGMYIYAVEHDKKFPDSIKELYQKKYIANTGLLDCPRSKNIGGIDSPDYIYHAGLSANDDSFAILLEDKNGNHAGRGKNVLYVNGSVDWIQE